MELKIQILKNIKDGSGTIEISGPVALKENFRSSESEQTRGFTPTSNGEMVENIPDDEICCTMKFQITTASAPMAQAAHERGHERRKKHDEGM